MSDFSDPRDWMYGQNAHALIGYVDGLAAAGSISAEVATEVLRRAKAFGDDAARIATASTNAQRDGKVFLKDVTMSKDEYERLKTADPSAFYAVI